MSLKTKTVNGLFWSFIENFSKQGVNFIIGIILARLLLPEQFGLIGMISVFIAISTSIINSGFTQALIRKKDCTDADYSTVFFFNLVTGVFLSAVLFLTSPLIADFFGHQELKNIVKVLSIILIINSVTIIQRTKLTKRIDFKLLTKISVISDLISGITAIILAYYNWGVWSLVAKLIISNSLNSIFLWLWNKWRPSFIFSKTSFKELFGFGWKLLVSGLINTIFQNIYYLVIGKYFSAAQLGFYTRADQFNKLPSQNINGIIQRVTYPVLANLQDDKAKLKNAYQKIIRSTMLITFLLMLGLGAVAEPLILTLLGEKWSQSIIYLQLLVFASMFYPLHSLNLNILNVQGRSDLVLKLQIVKKIIQIPVLIIGILYGIEWLIIGMIFNSIISYFLNTAWSGKFIGYSSWDQIKDIFPSFLFALFIAIITYTISLVIIAPNIVILITQLIVAFVLFILLSEVFKNRDYLYLKKIILEFKNK